MNDEALSAGLGLCGEIFATISLWSVLGIGAAPHGGCCSHGTWLTLRSYYFPPKRGGGAGGEGELMLQHGKRSFWRFPQLTSCGPAPAPSVVTKLGR